MWIIGSDNIETANKDSYYGINKEILDALTPAEKEAIEKILNEYVSEGKSKLYDELIDEDYEEIPVDIDTFIEDNEYIGLVTTQGTTIYPYWRKVLRKIFDPSHNYNESIFTGAIGLGKTTIAVTAMSYILYQLLCLKDPQKFYGLQSNSKIVLCFFNVTLDLSYGVAFKKLNSICMESPWFQRHGKIIGREEKDKKFYPDKGIEFAVGSSDTHGLGKDIFCVSGDTEIYTNEGIKRIQDLKDNKIHVLSYDSSTGIALSDLCSVKKTANTDEVYKVEFENGYILTCTGNHRLLTADGYVEVENLNVGTDIVAGFW